MILDRSNSQFCVLYDDAPVDTSIDGIHGDKSISRRWDGREGLTHVGEGEEEEEESGLGSLEEAESLWRNSMGRSSMVSA